MTTIETPAGSEAGPIPPAGDQEQERRRLVLYGPMVPALLRLAWPVLVSMLLHTLFNLVDSAWVGRVSPAALAAVTTARFAFWTLLGFAEMVSVGLTAHVARFVGAGDPAAARRAAAHGLWGSLLIALPFSVSALFLPAWLFGQLSPDPEVVRNGTVYLQWVFACAPPLFGLIAIEAILRAWGDTRTPMVLTGLALGLNMVLDPLLILGWGPFPRWEVAGAAVATVVSLGFGCAAAVIVLRRRPASAPRLGDFSPPWSYLAGILRIGLPTTLDTVLFSMVYLSLSAWVGRLGTSAMAALGVGNRLESLSYLTAVSLGVAAATCVGQNLGAGRLQRARRMSLRALGLVTIPATFYGLLFLLAGRPLFSIFTQDPEVQRLGALFMAILAVSQPFVGWEIVLFNSYAGAGYTLVPTIISTTVSLLRIPLGYWIVHHTSWGFGGVAWMITVTCMLRAVLLYQIFHRPHWLRARLGGGR
ncbi:MAG: MATE family efflux transporter [Candidatus Eisenbacteria bacterium]|nr:MATE family efflux transporter [Candidatus Eisenbacteria bacterium]